MNFEEMFEEGTFLYGRSNTCKEGMDKRYEKQRKKGLLSFIEKYSSIENQCFFSVHSFRTEGIDSADFWREKLGGNLSVKSFRNEIIFWCAIFGLPWQNDYERMFIFYKSRKNDPEVEYLERIKIQNLSSIPLIASIDIEKARKTEQRKRDNEYIGLRVRGIEISDAVSDFLLEEPIDESGYQFVPILKTLLLEMKQKRPDIWGEHKEALLNILKWGSHEYWDKKIAFRVNILFQLMNLPYVK